MAGRLITDTRVKEGELVPLDVTHLTNEEDKTIQRSAEMRAIYSTAHKLNKILTKHYGDVVAEPRKEVEGESESDIEEQKVGISSREKRLSRSKALKEMKASTAGEKHIYPTKERHSLRADILSASLFPNIFNRKNLVASM